MEIKDSISEKIKTFLKDKYNIDYIFPYKKNTKSNTSTTDKIALKERLRLWRSRYINENAISWLTQHRRLTNRYEIYKKTFLGFAFLAASNVIFKKLSV